MKKKKNMASGEKILGSSDLGYVSSLDLFDVPATNLGITDAKIISFNPVNAYNIEGNIKFRISGAGTNYIDLREIYLKSTVRIVRQGELNTSETQATPCRKQ